MTNEVNDVEAELDPPLDVALDSGARVSRMTRGAGREQVESNSTRLNAAGS